MAIKTIVPVPSPPDLLQHINAENPGESYLEFAEKYGEIFRLHFPSGNVETFVSTQALVHELCDESRFTKTISPVTKESRVLLGDALLSAHSDELGWGIAHRVLTPAFGPLATQGHFSDMLDLSTQFALRLAGFQPGTPIVPAEEFSRVAMDVLTKCSMNFSFDMMNGSQQHPFVKSIQAFFRGSGERARGALSGEKEKDRKRREHCELLRDTARQILRHRMEHPEEDRADLLSAMLNRVDPKTGQKMSEDSIVRNLITFLVAGQETTASAMSLVLYFLTSDPEAYRKAREEIDRVVGSGTVSPEHLPRLPYVTAVLREQARLWNSVAWFTVAAREDDLLGGKYAVKKGESVTVLVRKLHTDVTVWGESSEEFQPERMMDENLHRIMREFPDCYKPFGNGKRACIGRSFAAQEQTILLVVLLQTFDIEKSDPKYTLKTQMTPAVKPKDFSVRVTFRKGVTAASLEARLSAMRRTHGVSASASASASPPAHENGAPKPESGGQAVNIYFGSNTGTCQALAQRLAADAPSRGFSAPTIKPLDAAVERLGKDRVPSVLITASYEGQPPDNAASFFEWMQKAEHDDFRKADYAVFGCGDHNWPHAFHRIPKLVDQRLASCAATRICDMGLSDVAGGEVWTEFEQWEDVVFWPAMRQKYLGTDGHVRGHDQALEVEFSAPRSRRLGLDVHEAIVVENRMLSGPGVPLKKHAELRLPGGMQYRTGDYLIVLPSNPRQTVARVIRRFGLSWDAQVTIASGAGTSLPTGEPVSVSELLTHYVELVQPATKRNITMLCEASTDSETKEQLKLLAGDSYTAEISQKHVSVLHLLERFPHVGLSFGSFLASLPPMRVRQYSISSSPLRDPSRVTLTYALLDEPAHADPRGRHVGVATSFLAALGPGDRVRVNVRRSRNMALHLPEHAETTPLVMVAAGAGIAPFRGFLEERAAMAAAGRSLAPALLFFGSRGPALDDLYREELDAWQAAGLVDVRRAYSRLDPDNEAAARDAAESFSCRHVDDRLWRDRADVVQLWDAGARLYVCGSRRVGDSVTKVLLRIGIASMNTAEERCGMDLFD